MKRTVVLCACAGILALSACVLGSPNLVFDISDAHAYSISSTNFSIEGYLRNNGTETAHGVQGDYFLADSSGLPITSYRVTTSTSYPSDIPPGYSVYLQIQGSCFSTFPRFYTMTASYQDWRGNTMTVSKNSPFLIYIP